jgi:hypothetical protein
MKKRFPISGICLAAVWAALLAGCTGQPATPGTSAITEQSTLLSTVSPQAAQTDAVNPTPTPLQPQLTELIELTGSSDDALIAALGPGEEVKSENAEQINGREYRVGLFGGVHELVATLNEQGSVVELAITLTGGSDYEAIKKSVNEAAGHEPDQQTEDAKQRSCSWTIRQGQIDLVEAGGTAALTFSAAETA